MRSGEPKIRLTPKGRKPYYVYILAYPDGYITDDGINLSGTVFYVGKGKVSPPGINLQRIDHHEIEAQSECTCKKCGAIRQIWGKGLSVSKSIIYETDIEAEALSLEQSHIEHTYSGPYLTNRTYNQPKKQKIISQETEEWRIYRLRNQRLANSAFKRIIAEDKARKARKA